MQTQNENNTSKKKEKVKDRDIREPLFCFLEETYGNIRIIEEKFAGDSRADVVMIMKDSICGIEIKSDADTYARLASQVKDYDKYFDYNFAAVGSSHAGSIEEHVPEYWGIITIDTDEDGNLDFYILRHPKKNPNATVAKQLTILWRPELARIQEAHVLPAYNYLSKANVRKKILERIPFDELHADICYTLMNRDYTTIAEEINKYREEAGRKKRRRKKKRKPK